MAEHDPNHPYVRRMIGCGHGMLFTDYCSDCEIVQLRESYNRAIRTIAQVRDRMRQLGAPLAGYTSTMHRATGEPSRGPMANQAESSGSPAPDKPTLAECCPRCLRDGWVERESECKKHGTSGVAVPDRLEAMHEHGLSIFSPAKPAGVIASDRGRADGT
jgi:hypothetical protein